MPIYGEGTGSFADSADVRICVGKRWRQERHQRGVAEINFFSVQTGNNY